MAGIRLGAADLTPEKQAAMPLTALLNRWTPLQEQDLAALAEIKPKRVQYGRGTEFIRQDLPCGDLPLLESGWAAQDRVMQDGRRFILRMHLPGEMIDICFPIQQVAAYSASALTDVSLLLYPSNDLIKLVRSNPNIGLALLAITARQRNVLRHRILSLAGLNAYERLAHLCLELLVRLESLGLAEDDRFELPISQPTLGEVLGVHGVHINRMFRRLAEDGLIVHDSKFIYIKDRKAVAKMVEFDDSDAVYSPELPAELWPDSPGVTKGAKQ